MLSRESFTLDVNLSYNALLLFVEYLEKFEEICGCEEFFGRRSAAGGLVGIPRE